MAIIVKANQALSKMKLPCICNHGLLFVAVVGSLGVAMAASRSSIHLDIARNINPSGLQGGQVVNCSVDSQAAGFDHTVSLTIYGSSPYGSSDDFEQLAALDIWSHGPQLSDGLERADILVEGDLTSSSAVEPYLWMYWNSSSVGSRLSYKCLAKGIDKDGKARAVSKTVKPESDNVACCEKMGTLQGKVSTLSTKMSDVFNVTQDLSSQVQVFTNKFGQFEANSAIAGGKVSTQILTLTNKFTDLEAKVTDMDGQLSSLMQTLTDRFKESENKLKAIEQNIVAKLQLLRIDTSRFDVSEQFKDSVYLVSKAVQAFNIATANYQCRQSGGYLVEFDDDQEYQFVFDVVSTIAGANTFWTGGNDIDNEGTFVYYNSKKAFPQLAWSSAGQPDDHGGNEDCVEIRLNFGGLNDWLCNQPGKYVCEVLLKTS